MNPNENSKPVGSLSDSDRRLMERVRDLVVQARVSEGLLHAHFAAEYGLNDSKTVLADGSIWEQLPEANGSNLEE